HKGHKGHKDQLSTTEDTEDTEVILPDVSSASSVSSVVESSEINGIKGMNTELSERIKKLPPEKLDQLLKQLKPGAKLKQAAAPAKPTKRLFNEARDQNFYLTVKQPGVLDSLEFVTRPREELKPDYMEVEIHASCMNFRDVAVALGMYPMPPCGTMPEFGCDGAGKVVAV